VFVSNVAAHEDGWRGTVAISDGGDDRIEILVAVSSEVPLGPGSVRPRSSGRSSRKWPATTPETGRLHAMEAATSGGPGLRLDQRFPELWRTAFS
jgi:hypothetical protein